MPVPKGFRLVEQSRNGYDLEAWYQAPDGVTIDDLVAWFQRYVPPYRSWHAWTWCPAIRHNTNPYSGGGIWGWDQGPNGIRTLHAILMDTEEKVRIHLSRGSTGMCGNG